MAQSPQAVHWEQVSKHWYSSVLGYVIKEEGVWIAHVYHNQRTGEKWTESKRGFGTSVGARRWVENQAEA